MILRFGERGLSLGGEELGRGWVACDRVLVAIGLDLGDLLRSAAVGSDANCIFCKIVAGQIPCHKVYEDEVMLAFLDIGPIVRGHTLVIPKEHFGTVMETPGAVMAVMGAQAAGAGAGGAGGDGDEGVPRFAEQRGGGEPVGGAFALSHSAAAGGGRVSCALAGGEAGGRGGGGVEGGDFAGVGGGGSGRIGLTTVKVQRVKKVQNLAKSP